MDRSCFTRTEAIAVSSGQRESFSEELEISADPIEKKLQPKPMIIIEEEIRILRQVDTGHSSLMTAAVGMNLFKRLGKVTEEEQRIEFIIRNTVM